MKPLIDSDLLQQLGFAAQASLESEFVARPQAQTGEAAGRDWLASLSLAALLQVPPSTIHFEPVRSAVSEAAGIGLEEAREVPGVYRLTADRDTRLEVVARAESDVASVRSSDDPGVVVWDGRSSPVLRVMVSGRPVAFGSEAHGLRVETPSQALSLDAFASVDAPLPAWAATTGDSWLSAELRRANEIGGTWAHVVAAGMAARLTEPPETDISENVQALLAGGVIDELARARRWARSLTSDQRRTVEDLALAEADALAVLLDDVDAAASVEPNTLGSWLSICHRRDDLAGVLVLLGETGEGARLHAALEDIDRTGRRVRLNMPVSPRARDERLRRVADRQPYAWWGAALQTEDAGDPIA
jgi:hypothetical protein